MNTPSLEIRRFACTACGKCCDAGPEVELGEAAGLADVLLTSVVFKVHSLPLDERSGQAAAWWREQHSRIPLRAALQEQRRHLAALASRRRSDRQTGRELYLTIAAAVEDGGRNACPALDDHGRCGIHDRRPLTCRTVPLHYSRPPSLLRAYLDRFTATPGYRCDTIEGPVILDGSRIVSSDLRADRDRALDLAQADRAWKGHMLALMDDPQEAERCGLPSVEAILNNSDAGYATSLPMIVAWRVAEARGLITAEALADLCTRQLALIHAGGPQDWLPLYEAGAAGRGRIGHGDALLANRFATTAMR